jgi:phenylacetate-CoA ligase
MVQEEKLTEFLSDVVYPHSPHYRRLFDDEGISPSDIQTREDLGQLPFTTKEDLLPKPDNNDKYREFILDPDRDHLKSKWSNRLKALFYGRDSVKEEIEKEFRPIFITATTGRSSQPVAFFYTDHDMNILSRAGNRLVDVLGGQTEWKGVSLFPYAPHLAFWQVVFAALDFGMLVHSTGGGKLRGTEGNLELIERMNPEVLMGIPSYVYHIIREGEKKGVSFSNLEKIVLGGEAISPSGRENMIGKAQEAGAGDVNVTVTYAFTEARMAWGECPGGPAEPTGYHFYPDMNLFELRDPETEEIVPHEEGGELVYTPLDGRGSVVLRYRTGDICDSIQWGECPHCGRHLPRIMGPIHRVSKIEGLKLDKVKGTLVNFNDLQSLLSSHEVIREWQVELRKEDDDPMGLDELHLHVATKEGTDDSNATEQLKGDIREAIEVTPNEIHFHTYQEMLDRLGLETELKEERFLDNRPKPEE